MVPLPETVLPNRFPEYPTVMLSRCDYQQTFVPARHFLILKKAKNRSWLSQANKMDSPFL
jgi:hypothetical protein